jgi:prepilin-type N-terminal cleavage/methylation domain-containing protein
MMARRLRTLARQDGFTMIELLMAMLVLVVGMGAMVTTMTAAQKLTLVAERQTSMAHRANLELERVKSLPYNDIALTAGTSPYWSTNSSNYTYVNVPSGACPSQSTGTAPTYQPDHSKGGSSSTEPLVVNGCSYTLSGASTAVSGGTIAPVTAWTDGRFSGYIYDFVTFTSDPTCSQTTTPGSACPVSNDYKRITIVVSINGVAEPSHPAIVTAFLPNPNQNSQQNPNSPTSQCTNTSGQSVSCNTVPQQPVQYFLCDSPYSSSSCSPPPCSGNNLHDTLVSALGSAPSPDALETTLPTGSCTDSSGNPTPPCYGLNLLSNCVGLPIPTTPICTSNCGSSGGSGTCTGNCGGYTGAGSTTCGTTAPSSNTQAHSWVTSPMYTGTNLNLSGAGSLTTYLESSTGVAVNATVCLGLYVVPGGVLGNLTGNLLSTPIGAVVAANVSVAAGIPTPVSFNFNFGSADTVTGSLLGTRIEAVVWLAASASTDVQVGYDQAEFASQLTLETT